MARFLITYYAGDMPQNPESIEQARHAFAHGAPVGPFMGWSVIEAEDSGAAVRLVRDHPFLSRGAVLQLSEPI